MAKPKPEPGPRKNPPRKGRAHFPAPVTPPGGAKQPKQSESETSNVGDLGNRSRRVFGNGASGTSKTTKQRKPPPKKVTPEPERPTLTIDLSNRVHLPINVRPNGTFNETGLPRGIVNKIRMILKNNGLSGGYGYGIYHQHHVRKEQNFEERSLANLEKMKKSHFNSLGRPKKLGAIGNQVQLQNLPQDNRKLLQEKRSKYFDNLEREAARLARERQKILNDPMKTAQRKYNAWVNKMRRPSKKFRPPSFEEHVKLYRLMYTNAETAAVLSSARKRKAQDEKGGKKKKSRVNPRLAIPNPSPRRTTERRLRRSPRKDTLGA
jgi:hypothetical protein